MRKPGFSNEPANHERSTSRPDTARGAAGQGVPHDSAHKQVSGQALYIDDIPEPKRTVHVAVGRANVVCGVINSLDLTDVRAQPGVLDVIVLDDVPGHKDIGPVYPGDPLFADGEVMFFGQALFAVAADSHENARKAVQFAHVDITPTTPILDPLEAVKQQKFVRPSHVMQRGDADQAIDNAPYVLTGQQSVGGQEHYYLEGQVALVSPTEDGGLFVQSSTQHPSEIQTLVAEVLAIPFSQVTVETRRLGGAFGGKETNAAQWNCIAAVFAKRLGRAVKLRLPRADDMVLTGKRHPFENQYRIGFNEEGQLLGAEFTVVGDCGCSPDLSDAIVDRAMFHADNAYFLPAAHIVGHRAFTNKVSNTAFRGFGGPQGMVLVEQVMDDIAHTIGKDPLTIRKLNLYGGLDRNVTPYHQTVNSESLIKVVEQLEVSSDYWARRQAIAEFNQSSPILKKGLSLTPVKFGISFTLQHLNQAGALLHVYTDGSVQINHGGVEMGQGLNTKVAQVVASIFQIDLDSILITATRTDKVPNTSPTAASSGADLNGQAAKAAALIIKKRLTEFLVASEGCEAASIEFTNNRICFGEGQHLSFAQLAQKAYAARVSLSATGYYKTPEIYYDRAQAKGRPFFYFATGASVSEVTVDTLTGEYRVDRVDILHDVGDSLNPALDIGQIEGGFIQGMGWLTTEELKWDDQGRLLTLGAATYKIPAIADTPPVFNVSLLENHPNEERTIFRSKAVGEPPFMLAMSVWSALRDAVSSVRTDPHNSTQLDIPATPERVYWAIQQAKADSHG